jgi:PadR family transcriptional regulator, regulatory protein AphA
MELSKTAYVVLGMLSLGRRTGYEIKSLVDVSIRNFWAASYGQIYPELRRLEEAGLVTGTDDDSDGRRRRAYELTPAGKRALHAWLASDDLSMELRHEGSLKLFFADVLDPDEQLALIRATRSVHERALEHLHGLHPPETSPDGRKHSPLRVLEWGIELNEFYVDWCNRVEREIEAERNG